MEGDAKGSVFKMKGHTLPGINQKSSKNKSSAFQFGSAVMGSMGAAGNMAQQRNKLNVQNPMAPPVDGTAIGNPPIMSKPSAAKKYGTFSKYKTFKK